MKDGPTIFMKTKDRENGFLEGPTILMKTRQLITRQPTMLMIRKTVSNAISTPAACQPRPFSKGRPRGLRDLQRGVDYVCHILFTLTASHFDALQNL